MHKDEFKIQQLNKEEFKALMKETFEELLTGRSNGDSLIGVAEAAAMLSLAVATIYEKTSNKTIPHYKHGKKILFKRSELLAWVESRRVKTIHDIRKEANASLRK